MQSLIPFPILPQPKQKIDNYSYLKEIHDLELLSRETKMPPRKGFYTSKLILNSYTSPIILDLKTPPKVIPMACNISFLSNSGRHEPNMI